MSNPCLEPQPIIDTYWVNQTARLYFGDMKTGERFSLLSNCFCWIISLVTAVVLAYLTRLVVKKLGSKEVIIPSMLISLFFSCVSLIIFFSYQIDENLQKIECVPTSSQPPPI